MVRSQNDELCRFEVNRRDLCPCPTDFRIEACQWYNSPMSRKPQSTTERELYEPIKDYLTEAFEEKFGNCHLEITADGVFSALLKKVVRYDIIFSFLGRKASPDLTGFVHSRGSEVIVTYGPHTVDNFITVEIKPGKVTVQDICQAKMYGDLFSAKYAFLISPQPIPEEIRRLDKQLSVTGRYMSGWVVYVGEWVIHEGCTIIGNWLPASPL